MATPETPQVGSVINPYSPIDLAKLTDDLTWAGLTEVELLRQRMVQPHFYGCLPSGSHHCRPLDQGII